MPFDDDDTDGSAYGGPPLPPEDRLWRHPSEMGPDHPDHPGGPRWVAVAAALGGAGLALAVLALSGSFDRTSGEDPAVVERVAAPAVATVPVVDGGVAQGPMPPSQSLVTVEAADDQTGSGFVLRSDGHVVTAAALVGDDEQVQVVSGDGERGTAAVVGTDTVTGVAVLAVSWLAGRSGAVLGSNRTLTIGDEVTTVPAGEAVPAAGQVSDVSASTMAGDQAHHGLVRTTSSLPTNGMGAPVVDTDGHVVGVALWADPSPATWAAPIDLARQVADDIIVEGQARHSWLGVEGEDGRGGPRLQAVSPGSPADRAGLVVGDVLVEVGDRPVMAMADVILALRELAPGDTVTIEYRRDDHTRYCTAELDELET
jgi:putative serine protease PepD